MMKKKKFSLSKKGEFIKVVFGFLVKNKDRDGKKFCFVVVFIDLCRWIVVVWKTSSIYINR